MRKRNSGFSLIELMIALVILSISFGLAVPGFKGMMARNRVATQTNELLLAINLARSEAGKMGRTVSLQATDPSDSGNEFGAGFCVVVGNPGECKGDIIRTFDPKIEDLRLDSVENIESLQFSPLGSLANTAGAVRNIDVCYPGSGGRRLFISLIGRAKSHKPDDLDEAKQPAC